MECPRKATASPTAGPLVQETAFGTAPMRQEMAYPPTTSKQGVAPEAGANADGCRGSRSRSRTIDRAKREIAARPRYPKNWMRFMEDALSRLVPENQRSYQGPKGPLKLPSPFPRWPSMKGTSAVSHRTQESAGQPRQSLMVESERFSTCYQRLGRPASLSAPKVRYCVEMPGLHLRRFRS